MIKKTFYGGFKSDKWLKYKPRKHIKYSLSDTVSLFGLWGEQMGGKVIKIKIKKWSQTHPFGAVFYTKVCVNQAKIKCLNRKRDWVTRCVCEERGRWLTTNWIVELSESDRWRLTRTTRLLQKMNIFNSWP